MDFQQKIHLYDKNIPTRKTSAQEGAKIQTQLINKGLLNKAQGKALQLTIAAKLLRALQEVQGCRIAKIAASFFYLSLHLAENIIEEQEDAQNIERRIQILELTHHHLDQYIAQNTEADAIGDAVAEYHRNHRDKGRE